MGSARIAKHNSHFQPQWLLPKKDEEKDENIKSSYNLENNLEHLLTVKLSPLTVQSCGAGGIRRRFLLRHPYTSSTVNSTMTTKANILQDSSFMKKIFYEPTVET